jgi:hypothetical protein
MPAEKDRATWAVAGVRKPPKNEPAGDVRGKRRWRSGLMGFSLIEVLLS